MTFVNQRQQMVAEQLETRHIDDPRVLDAMAAVPREQFVQLAQQQSAYNDSALPLEHHQTISQPYTVAFMAQALRLKSEDVVLEIGTGSGYGAAVLSRLAKRVDTIERIPELASQARERLKQLGYSNVRVFVGDGTSGLPEHAPYDAICVTAAGQTLPPAYAAQLKPGGRILIPLVNWSDAQTMTLFTKTGTELKKRELGSFRFVPLIGAYAVSPADR
ncbi:protein-L-isoaspartate(D-aspartate) O-methyltransferase [Planctomicrobium piriforme]|uniref:Protein-L-isoaspartate O-methyltransferase n=1 Tax=Planctomicrobium piriforme TaxID=1576369 RepID=A0A1I3G6T0_9PLAN|nr:protein-L-isoaspartate(D-aspartate) O-methyltransferase [Planctomicrobium piriforme]SFI19107.1 protein-L-isoaspartate(D-aspartate) O-methyltransferase [Planctomicrobium piriforme]